MVDSTGSADLSHRRGVDLRAELDDDHLWWTGIRAILSASESEMRAMEDYLHLVREDRSDGLDQRAVATLLDQAITSHERAVEDLRLAKRTVHELADEA